MKSIFFTLPLLAALASARAVASAGPESALACATAFTKCIESAVSAGSVQGLQCMELKDACVAAILPRNVAAAAPAPQVPGLDISKIIEAIEKALGQNSGIDTKALATKIHNDISANGFDVGTLINAIINAFDGKAGGVDVGKIINEIIKAIGGIAGEVHAASLLDIPKLINTIIQIVGDGKNIDVGKLVQAIVSLIAEVVGGIGGIIPGGLSVNASAGVNGSVQATALPFDFSQLINGILKLISGSGGFDIGKLIELIMKLIGSIPKPGH
ncbi:uncharacterized protein GIQ15_06975 [Arthroderma uncinatum]|uniref:uncharacterized protein n=1 Tax=Arthroderma uncinatum TaxID=74035 RepID=UPI00144AE015|nr:uncharacterized protein GIQ15_06975 [Arthroderma uncinatum]KAF3479999.1 hypothetical protein GIQ15_06975 [Arthroderma uncinatum]